MTTTNATRRFLNVVMPFERSLSGRLIGGLRIVVPPPSPYAATDYYTVSIGETDAIFVKEGKGCGSHVVDLDFMSCDCAGWHYRKTCRHVECLRTLRTRKII